MPEGIWHGRRITSAAEIFNLTMTGSAQYLHLRIVPVVLSLRVHSSSSEWQSKNSNIMAKLRWKLGQTVLLLDDSSASSPALKKT
jgi:hypothetical protein